MTQYRALAEKILLGQLSQPSQSDQLNQLSQSSQPSQPNKYRALAEKVLQSDPVSVALKAPADMWLSSQQGPVIRQDFGSRPESAMEIPKEQPAWVNEPPQGFWRNLKRQLFELPDDPRPWNTLDRANKVDRVIKLVGPDAIAIALTGGVGIPATRTAIGEAVRMGTRFAGMEAVNQIYKGAMEAAIPEKDYEYQGAQAVAGSFVTGAALSMAFSGAKAIWKALSPVEQSAALRYLGLKEGASEDEIRRAAQNLAKQYHPDKVKGKVDDFMEVIRMRDQALKERGTSTQDIVKNWKLRPKLAGEVEPEVAVKVSEPIKPVKIPVTKEQISPTTVIKAGIIEKPTKTPEIAKQVVPVIQTPPTLPQDQRSPVEPIQNTTPAEEIYEAAVYAAGKIFTGANHGIAVDKAIEDGALERNTEGILIDTQTGEDVAITGKIDLFTTTKGNLVDRFEASQKFGISAAENIPEQTNIIDPSLITEAKPKEIKQPWEMTREEYNQSGIVPEWGTRNQYYVNSPFRKQLDEFKTTGQYDEKVLHDSERWEMEQVLKDKPAYLSDSNFLLDDEILEFAKQNSLVTGRDKHGYLVIAKNQDKLDRVIVAKGQRELGIALGYEDIGKPSKYNTHKSIVKNALRKGKPVPPSVLAEYPELTKTVQPKGTENALQGKEETPQVAQRPKAGAIQPAGATEQAPAPVEKKSKGKKSEGKKPSGGSGLGSPGSSRSVQMSLEPEPSIGKTVSKHEIIKTLTDLFRVPIKGLATHKMRSFLGKYWPRVRGIRMVRPKDIITASHEVGHHIDYAYGIRQGRGQYPAGTSDELLAMGKALYGNKKPKGGYKGEGVAEYIRGWLTESFDVAQTAPNFHRWFNDTYLEDHPDIAKALYRIKRLYTVYRKQGSRARIRSGRVMGKIPTPVLERLRRTILRFRTAFIDEQAPLIQGMKDAGIDLKKLKPTEDPSFLYAIYADKAGAIMRYMATKAMTDLAGKETGPSLKQVLSPVAGEIDRFLDWAEAAKAIQLSELGIEPGIDIQDAKFIYEKDKNPVYEEVLNGWTEWSRGGLKYMLEAGAITQDIYDKVVQKHPIYIPFIRAFEEGEKRTGPSGTGRGLSNKGKPIHGIKGSDRPRVDPILSSVSQLERQVSIAHKVMVSRALASMSNREGVAGLIWRVPAPQQAVKFTAEKIKDQLDQMGIDTEGIGDEMLTIFQDAAQYRGKDNIVRIDFGGEPHWYEVSKDLYRILEGLDQYQLPWFADLMFGKLARLTRLGATGINPAFGLIRNPIRDIGTAAVTAKHGLTPLSSLSGIAWDVAGKASDVLQNFGIDLGKAEIVDRFEAMGGKMASQIQHDINGQKIVRGEILASNGKRYVVHTTLHPITALREICGLSETGVRIGEFEKALKWAESKYGRDTLDAYYYAFFQGQDVTTNFTRHGSVAKVVNQMWPFTNAAIQGIDKLFRAFRDSPIRAGAGALAFLTIPAIWLWYRNRDKDWYKNMADYEKFGYLHYQVDDDTIVRWPVPFEPGILFQSLPVAWLDQMYNDDPGQVEDALKNLADKTMPNLFPATLQPIVDIGTNQDFAGRPIVPRSQENKLPQDQYKPYTTGLMKLIGKQIGVSPAKLEHLVNSYTAGLYGRIYNTFHTEQARAGSDMPVLGTLILRDPNYPRDQLDKFHETKDLLDRKKASKAATSDELRQVRVYDKIGLAINAQMKKLPDLKTQTERNEVYNKIKIYLNKLDKYKED